MIVYNYDFDIAALIILFLGALCLIVLPKITSQAGFWLTLLFITGFFYNILDIITSFLVAHPGSLPNVVMYGVADIYFITVFYFPYLFFLYIITITETQSKFRYVMAIPSTVNLIILLLFNVKYSVYFHFSETGAYTLGAQVWATYVNWAVYVMIILVFVIKHRRFLGTVRVHVTGSLAVVVIVVAVIQILYPSVMVLGLAIAICIVVFMLVYHFIDDSIDRLTGIAGRSGFYRETEALLVENRNSHFVLIRLDIHHLRDINERYGMTVGNLLLQDVAEKLKKIVRTYGTYGYLGSDDFVCCVPTGTVEEQVLDMDFSQLDGLEYISHEVNGHFGLYYIEDRKMSINLMCDRAEYALRGISGNYLENVVCFNDSMKQDMQEQRALERDMFQALSQNCFQVYYQPIYDLETREVVSAEALVRWKHSKKGMISPGAFIPLFEKNGFITELDQYIVTKVCSDMNEWKHKGKHLIPVSVNMSRQDLNGDKFCAHLSEELRHFGLEEENIKLELTESSFSENLQQLTRVLQGLRELGHSVLMDDFGSGYSSFYMFQNLPVDILKIDMNFLDNLESSKRGRIIVESIVSMTKRLDIPVIVEGVETKEQVEFLRTLHCEQVQGFYFSKPLEKRDFEILL